MRGGVEGLARPLVARRKSRFVVAGGSSGAVDAHGARLGAGRKTGLEIPDFRGHTVGQSCGGRALKSRAAHQIATVWQRVDGVAAAAAAASDGWWER